jgi:mono/diheme cytochrome c family protein
LLERDAIVEGTDQLPTAWPGNSPSETGVNVPMPGHARLWLRFLVAGGTVVLTVLGSPAQDKAKVEAGETVYNTYCATCHGDGLISSGQTFDLRKLSADARSRFETSVLNGKGQMPPWKGVLSSEEIDQLWHYIRANAYEN